MAHSNALPSMRILMLSWEYPPHVVGGLGKHVIDLLPALANEGVEIILVTPQLQGGVTNETVDPLLHIVRVLPTTATQNTFTSFVAQVNLDLEQAACSLYTQLGGFDLIHNHDWMTAATAIRLKRQWGIPLLTTVHATERGRGRGQLLSDHSVEIDRIEHNMVHESHRVVVCSNYMATQVVNDFQLARDRIFVVPNAVYIHPDPFTDDDERQSFRRRFAEPDEKLAFFIGRMVSEKGLHVLLKAWPRVLSSVRARLVVAGIGPHLEEYRAMVRSEGLGHFVSFMGQISDGDRDRLYHTADVAVFPSIYEPFGIVALEAMAARCPVVVTQTGGLQEIVCPHETGITVVPDHIDSLAWGVMHTLHNPVWARARAANALRDLSQVYSWQHVAQETHILYERMQSDWQANRLQMELLQPSEKVLIE